jgi:sugar/nucleoside kinase (ribokinase family)
VQPDGLRTPQAMPNVAEWCACTDLLQVNEDELALLAPDGLALAATAMAQGVRALSVTLGARGAIYFASPGFDTLGDLHTPPSRGAIRTARIPAVPILDTDVFDPTGCGDVWGATQFARLLAGDTLEAAMRLAHLAAARNVRHRGATGLADHLRGALSRT